MPGLLNNETSPNLVKNGQNLANLVESKSEAGENKSKNTKLVTLHLFTYKNFTNNGVLSH